MSVVYVYGSQSSHQRLSSRGTRFIIIRVVMSKWNEEKIEKKNRKDFAEFIVLTTPRHLSHPHVTRDTHRDSSESTPRPAVCRVLNLGWQSDTVIIIVITTVLRIVLASFEYNYF